MPVLFEPFTRGHSNAMDPRMRPGFGLGLATANSLVRLMGGQLQLRSRSGEGSDFLVGLPAAGPQDEPAAPPPAAAEAEAPAGQRRGQRQTSFGKGHN